MEEWFEQIHNSVNTVERLSSFISVTDDEKNAIHLTRTRWGTTPHFASLMDKDDPECPIRRQVIPSMEEVRSMPLNGAEKPHEYQRDTEDMPGSILRKYPDRVAFLVTDRCAGYCRYCFRKDMVMNPDRRVRLNVDEGLRWIQKNREIRDVLITGGDPFILSDDRIEHLVRKLREISHVEMIRFGTRTPILLPQRITAKLKKAIGGFHRIPVWVNIQCNHPKEITGETARAVYDLISWGINVGNQAVLLKGINDDLETFTLLHRKLLSVRVRPYYLFHCEPAPGNHHFRTRVAAGIELIRKGLYGHASGLARPMYAIDSEDGKELVEAEGVKGFMLPDGFGENGFHRYKTSELIR
ncbi:MAG: KamA family radical SAM protein [Thermodesulfobacteriota bacterium]